MSTPAGEQNQEAGLNTADVIAHALKSSGVELIFGYPGDQNIELIERAQSQGMEIVAACRESAAAFMAEGAAMTTGGLGACISTLGPGSTAMVNGVAAANLDRVAMVAISGQLDTSRETIFTHQYVDHEALYRPVTKWATHLLPEIAATTMRKAIRTATAERPGAVHISVPANVFKAAPEDGQVLVPPAAAIGGWPQVFALNAGDDPVRRLEHARKPLLLVGIGAMRAGAKQAVERLAATVGMPVVVAPMAKGVIDERSDWFAGVLDMACNQIVWDLLEQSDLILAAGFDAVELIKPWTVPAPVIHIDMTPNTDQVYFSDLEVVGDIRQTLEWLAEGWHGQPRWSERDLRSYRAKLHDGYYEGRVSGRLNPTDVVDTARAVLPPGTIATSDVGSHKLLVGQGWTTYEPRAMLITNGLSSMGFGLSAALGAKLAQPEHPVVAFIGDGGFAMAATELRIAAARRLAVAVVVFSDGSLNRIALKQAALGYPPVATQVETTDMVAIAKALNCEGVRVSSAPELETALTQFLADDAPLLIEAEIDPAQYESQF